MCGLAGCCALQQPSLRALSLCNQVLHTFQQSFGSSAMMAPAVAGRRRGEHMKGMVCAEALHCACFSAVYSEHSRTAACVGSSLLAAVSACP